MGEVRSRMQAHAGVAELADAYGSGPYESNLMGVQVPSPAPANITAPAQGLFSCPGTLRGLEPREG